MTLEYDSEDKCDGKGCSFVGGIIGGEVVR